MRLFMVLVVVAVVGIAALMASPVPGHTRRVKHRIHVPTKIHTVFVTKFIKVPEHHHHHHVIKKEQHHHHHHKTPQLTHHKLSKYHDEESVFEEDHFDHDSGI